MRKMSSHVHPSSNQSPLMQTVDLLGLPACLLDEKGSTLHLNQAWRSFTGVETIADDTTPWAAFVHPDHRSEAQAYWTSITGSGDAESIECPMLDRDGTPHWFLLKLQPTESGPPSAAHWICIASDIHALKLREAALTQQASLQADMLNISVDCIKLITLDGKLVHMNKAGCNALGVPEDSSFGMPWLPLLPENVHQAGEAALQQAKSGVSSRFPGRSITVQHEEQLWDNLLNPILGPDGLPTAILCISREVTAERKALELLKASEERLAIAARVGGLGIWDYDAREDKLHCDESWYRIMGRDPNTPIHSLAELRPFVHPDDVDTATEFAKTAAELIAMDRDYSIAFRIIRPSGDIRWLRSLAYLQQENGVPVRAVGFVNDITDAWRGELALRDANRALEEERTSLARKILEDPLTGIANRRHLDSEFARIWIRANELEEPLCVGMIDVDLFKQFNDRYGHPGGDAALRKIAGALQSVARQSDLVARYGGEEFAFVLAGATDPIPAIERFMAAIADLAIPHEDSPSGRLSISCGAIVAPLPTLSPKKLIRESDKVLYEAKLGGRDRYVVRRLES